MVLPAVHRCSRSPGRTRPRRARRATSQRLRADAHISRTRIWADQCRRSRSALAGSCVIVDIQTPGVTLTHHQDESIGNKPRRHCAEVRSLPPVRRVSFALAARRWTRAPRASRRGVRRWQARRASHSTLTSPDRGARASRRRPRSGPPRGACRLRSTSRASAFDASTESGLHSGRRVGDVFGEVVGPVETDAGMPAYVENEDGGPGTSKPRAPPRRSAPRLRRGAAGVRRPCRSRRPRTSPPLRPHRRRGPPPRGIRVHRHDRPLPTLDLPGDRLAPRPLRRRDPEPLSRGRAAGAPPPLIRYRGGLRSSTSASAPRAGRHRPPAPGRCPRRRAARPGARPRCGFAEHVLGTTRRLASQVDVLSRERAAACHQTLGAGGLVAIRVARPAWAPIIAAPPGTSAIAINAAMLQAPPPPHDRGRASLARPGRRSRRRTSVRRDIAHGSRRTLRRLY